MSQDWNGVGKVNEANEVMEINDKTGSILVQVESDASTEVAMSFCKNSAPNTPILTDQDAQNTAEATGYSGNGADLVFSGQSLNVLHVIPKSLTVHPTGAGTSVDATDRDGDGILYTDDVDEDACGTINYSTGALYLSYPAGKAPGAGGGGAITATYKSTGSIVAKGVKAYRINNLKHNESVKVYAQATTTPVPLKVSVFGG